MPKRMLLLAAAAFVLTAGAGLLLWHWSFQGVTVLRLRHAVPALAPLALADVERVTIPRTAVPAGALRSPQELSGLYTTGPLPKGDTLLQGHLQNKPPAPSDTPLGTDERLISLPIDPTRALAGDLRTGDRVSVLAIAPRRDPKTPPPEPTLLMDHIQLVGLRTKAGLATSTGEPAAAVLRLTLDQATRLAATVQDGQTIWLLLAQRGEAP